MNYAVLHKRLKAAASRETAYDPDAWDPKNPLKGHCGAVSYIIQSFLGGDIIQGKVQGESHLWNRLPDGRELDFTASQFGADGYEPLAKGRVAKPRKTTNPRFIEYAKKVGR